VYRRVRYGRNRYRRRQYRNCGFERLETWDAKRKALRRDRMIGDIEEFLRPGRRRQDAEFGVDVEIDLDVIAALHLDARDGGAAGTDAGRVVGGAQGGVDFRELEADVDVCGADVQEGDAEGEFGF